MRSARTHGCRDIILLICTSSYSATADKSILLTIPHLRDTFNVHAGLSDHSMGVGVALAGVALGAEVIEKHMTLRRADGGVDSAFSTPFDDTAVDFLETLHVPCYKIASFEMTDINLIKKVAQQGKPMLMSTGMASLEEGRFALTRRGMLVSNAVIEQCFERIPQQPETTA